MRHIAWILVLAGATVAAAADEPSYNWNGFYVGAQLGGALALTDVDDPFGPSLYGDTVRSRGATIGGQAGYNWQFGRTVLGVEAEAAWADADSTNTCLAFSGFFVSANCRAETEAVGTLAGRWGWLLGPDAATMLYGKAGAAWAYQKVSATTNADAGFPTQDADGVRWGWMLGAGAERALSGRWSLKAEYDFVSLGDGGLSTPMSNFQSVPSADPTTMDTVASTATDFSTDLHLIKIGLNYRLGQEAASTSVPALPRPILGTTLEIGARYVYGWGRFQKDLGIQGEGVTSLASRLTYSDLTTNGAEMFARLDLANGLVAKGFVGKGTGEGKLNDEDWGIPFAIFVPYSNTWSKVDDEIRYGVIDIGYDVWRDAQFRVTPFVGYSILHQYMKGFGCVQIANPNSDCNPTIPVSVFAISEDDTWKALRLGVAGDMQLVPGLTLGVDAAYLPYVRFGGTDDHILRSLISPEFANASGAQLEVLLSYAVAERWKLGIGGRYWTMSSPGGVIDFGGTGNLVPMRFGVEQAALLVQGSYTFGDAAE